jgi:hypothetical protein
MKRALIVSIGDEVRRNFDSEELFHESMRRFTRFFRLFVQSAGFNL